MCTCRELIRLVSRVYFKVNDIGVNGHITNRGPSSAFLQYNLVNKYGEMPVTLFTLKSFWVRSVCWDSLTWLSAPASVQAVISCLVVWLVGWKTVKQVGRETRCPVKGEAMLHSKGLPAVCISARFPVGRVFSILNWLDLKETRGVQGEIPCVTTE